MSREEILEYAETKLPNPATFENDQIRILVPTGNTLEYLICTFDKHKQWDTIDNGETIVLSFIWRLSHIEES